MQNEHEPKSNVIPFKPRTHNDDALAELKAVDGVERAIYFSGAGIMDTLNAFFEAALDEERDTPPHPITQMPGLREYLASDGSKSNGTHEQ